MNVSVMEWDHFPYILFFGHYRNLVMVGLVFIEYFFLVLIYLFIFFFFKKKKRPESITQRSIIVYRKHLSAIKRKKKKKGNEMDLSEHQKGENEIDFSERPIVCASTYKKNILGELFRALPQESFLLHFFGGGIRCVDFTGDGVVTEFQIHSSFFENGYECRSPTNATFNTKDLVSVFNVTQQDLSRAPVCLKKYNSKMQTEFDSRGMRTRGIQTGVKMTKMVIYPIGDVAMTHNQMKVREKHYLKPTIDYSIRLKFPVVSFSKTLRKASNMKAIHMTLKVVSTIDRKCIVELEFKDVNGRIVMCQQDYYENNHFGGHGSDKFEETYLIEQLMVVFSTKYVQLCDVMFEKGKPMVVEHLIEQSLNMMDHGLNQRAKITNDTYYETYDEERNEKNHTMKHKMNAREIHKYDPLAEGDSYLRFFIPCVEMSK